MLQKMAIISIFCPGWSTTIPCFNPTEVVENIRRLMRGEEQMSMRPWWRGFKGEIIPTAKHKYDVHGIIRKLNDTTVEITELPIHKWTQNYKAELEAMVAGGENKEGVIKVSRALLSGTVGAKMRL